MVTTDDALRAALEGAVRAAWPSRRVVGAGSAADAGALLARAAPAAVLLDLGLAGAELRGLAHALRGVPVVGVSDGAAPETMLAAEALGIAGFLRSPVEPATLATILPRVLEAARPEAR